MDQERDPLWLSEAEVQELCKPSDAYAAVREALRCHAQQTFVQPLKPYIRPKGRGQEHEGGRFIAMPAYVGGDLNYAGIKWIAGFPANVQRGLPRASGLLALNSCDDGRLLALMPCETLSARRTGAVAAISFDHLAPPGPQSVGVIGSGPIGRSVIEALLDKESGSRDIRTIHVCDLRRERAEQLAAIVSGRFSVAIQVHEDPKPCVEQSNVIIPATTGSKEYIESGWMRNDGWLFVGLSLDDARPEILLSADKVIVDDWEQACREEKLLHRLVQQGRFSRERLYATLGEIIVGKPGREKPTERIYVNPMGMAVEDVATGARIYEKAIVAGAGRRLS